MDNDEYADSILDDLLCFVFLFLLFYRVHLLGATEMFSSLIAPCKYPESRSK